MRYAPFTINDLERILEYMNENYSYKHIPEVTSYQNYLEGIHKKSKRTRRSKIKDEVKKTEGKAKKIEYKPLIKTETMDKNKKLRLLVTAKCHNDCPMCCNKQFDFDTLPIVDRWDYDEIMITGGEPLSSLKKVRYLSNLVQSIKVIQQAQGLPISKFYLYTSTHHPHLVVKIMRDIDGIVYTPHNLAELNTLLAIIRSFSYYDFPKSFRLNIPCDIKETFEACFNKYHTSDKERLKHFWKIKYIEWIENCPIPEGEDFRRIYMLY